MSYQKANLSAGVALYKEVSKQAKGYFGFACGIITGVALASTIVVSQLSDTTKSVKHQIEIQRQIADVRAGSPRTRKRSPKKKRFSGRKIRFADEIDKQLVHVREFVKGSPPSSPIPPPSPTNARSPMFAPQS